MMHAKSDAFHIIPIFFQMMHTNLIRLSKYFGLIMSQNSSLKNILSLKELYISSLVLKDLNRIL